MEKEFVPYKLALRLKKLGFNEPCFGFYKLDDVDVYYDTILQGKNHKFRNNDELNIHGDLKEKISAPTFSQAFRWFREKHNLYSAVIPYNPKKDYYECVVRGIEEEDEDDDWEVHDTYGYSEAELACLNKLIEIVESKSE